MPTQKETVTMYANQFRKWTTLEQARKKANAKGTPVNKALAECWGDKLTPNGFKKWKTSKNSKRPWSVAPEGSYDQCRAENKNKDSPSPKRRTKRSPSPSPKRRPKRSPSPSPKRSPSPSPKRRPNSSPGQTGRKSVLDLLAECYKDSNNIKEAKTKCSELTEKARRANNAELQEWLHLHATNKQLDQLKKNTGSTTRRGYEAALKKWKTDWKPATYDGSKRRSKTLPDVADKADCLDKLRENENYGYSHYSPNKRQNVYKKMGLKAARKDCDDLIRKEYVLQNDAGDTNFLSAAEYDKLTVYTSIPAGRGQVKKGELFRTEKGKKVYEKETAKKSICWTIIN
jgi:hypothetical protein